MMKLNQSQVMLGIVLIVTLALTWQTLQEEQNVETVLPTRVVAAEQNKPHVHTQQHTDLTLVDRPLVPLAGDLFAAPKRIEPKAVKRIYRKQAAQNKLVAVPPLPFRYMGRWQDKEAQAVMLDYRGEVLVVKQGDIVANEYKVEAIDESAGRLQIRFLIMSLNKTQTLQARVGQP